MEQQIRFCTTSDGVRIAYAVLGQGPPLVSVPGWISHLELDWQFPLVRARLEPFIEHFTLIRLDKRGVGMSQRGVGDYSLEARLRDLEAVVEDVKLRRFALMGLSDGGPTCIAYAARHQERVSRMVLYGTFANGNGLGGQGELREAIRAVVKAEWGVGSKMLTDLFLGEDADPARVQFFTAYQRAGATPEDALAILDATLAIDARDQLSKVKAPALVMHSRGDRVVPIELGMELAAGISGARFVSMDGPHAFVQEQQWQTWAEFSLEFLLEEKRKEPTRKRASAQAAAMVTILFTDIEGSTSLTQRLGDARAQEVLHSHNTIVRGALKANDGVQIKHTGDGIMASFPSASRALECAVAVQRAFAARNESGDEPILVRIGLNAGEPVAEDDDLFGAAVQLAARVCAQSHAGQILVSDVVRQLAMGKGFLFADEGAVALRGFEDPVRLYDVRWRDE